MHSGYSVSNFVYRLLSIPSRYSSTFRVSWLCQQQRNDRNGIVSLLAIILTNSSKGVKSVPERVRISFLSTRGTSHDNWKPGICHMTATESCLFSPLFEQTWAQRIVASNKTSEHVYTNSYTSNILVKAQSLYIMFIAYPYMFSIFSLAPFTWTSLNSVAACTQ